MEDAATAEISRAQIWQWIQYENGVLEDGRKISREVYDKIVKEELNKIKEMVGEKRFKEGKYDIATALFDGLSTDKNFNDFLTLLAYEKI